MSYEASINALTHTTPAQPTTKHAVDGRSVTGLKFFNIQSTKGSTEDHRVSNFNEIQGNRANDITEICIHTPFSRIQYKHLLATPHLHYCIEYFDRRYENGCPLPWQEPLALPSSHCASPDGVR